MEYKRMREFGADSGPSRPMEGAFCIGTNQDDEQSRLATV